jgi:P-type Ca2+ transporter type 2C
MAATIRDAAYWGHLPEVDALQRLGTTSGGLTEAEARTRLVRFGRNLLPRPRTTPWYLELAGTFVNFFALLLWTAAALAWIAGMPQLTWAIVLVVLVNGVFSYWQEYQAQRATQALEALLPRNVTVRRGGEERRVPAADVVPGDVLVLVEGDAVCADARIIEADEFQLDLASLTGESRPVPRFREPPSGDARSPVELPCLVFAGTSVARGRGEAVVFATGAATEFGRIAQLTQGQAERPSPLQDEIGHVTRFVTVLSIGIGVTFFGVGTTVGGLTPAAGFLFAVGLIAANVPEGLLPTLTLSLAMAVRRMARRNALVKRLSAVEALGATTVILTDKTGTLTENEMTVREVWAGGVTYRLTGVGYEPRGGVDGIADTSHATSLKDLLRTAALCCDARLLPPEDNQHRWSVIGDPTEAAILVAARKVGLTVEDLAACPRIAELPFDSARKRMTTVQRIGREEIACVKGAASEVTPRCIDMHRDPRSKPGAENWRDIAEAAHDALAQRGLRVLAVAARSLDPRPPGSGRREVDDVERDLTLLGFIAMEDPPRVEVPSSVAACRGAGVRIVMVTGDDPKTAAAIALEIGLHEVRPTILTGHELDALSDSELDLMLAHPDLLFARVSPEHKLRLVEAFQRRHDIVAVTGDGVNDAPALKRADIGVAMGVTGTDVAREAADMVLADDNFASIAAAIEEGRAVYENVRKFVTYCLSSNVPEAAPFVLFALGHVPLPLTVMQVLAVDLGTDLFPALALGAEKPEPGLMSRPPRPRSERLLDLPTVIRAYAWLGAMEMVFSLAAFFLVYWLGGWRIGEPFPADNVLYATATSVTFATIVASQVGNAFACRSARQSVFRLGIATNRLLLLGIGVELALLAMLVYVEPLGRLFDLVPISPAYWLMLPLFALLLLSFEEARKLVVTKLRSPVGRPAPRGGSGGAP